MGLKRKRGWIMGNTDRNCFHEGEALHFPPFFLTLFIEVCFPLCSTWTGCPDPQRSPSDAKGFIIPQRTEVAPTSLYFTGSSFLCFFKMSFSSHYDFSNIKVLKLPQPYQLYPVQFHGLIFLFKHILIDFPMSCVVLRSPRLWQEVQELERDLRTDLDNKDPVKEGVFFACFCACCLWVPCLLSSTPVLSIAFLLLWICTGSPSFSAFTSLLFLDSQSITCAISSFLQTADSVPFSNSPVHPLQKTNPCVLI